MMMKLMGMIVWVWLCGCLVVEVMGQHLGIPGARMTNDGYDNDKSQNPICWTTKGTNFAAERRRRRRERANATMAGEVPWGEDSTASSTTTLASPFMQVTNTDRDIIFNNSNSSGFPLQNPLVPCFRSFEEGIQLLPMCPSGLNLQVISPPLLGPDESRLTGQWHNYTIKATIDVERAGLTLLKVIPRRRRAARAAMGNDNNNETSTANITTIAFQMLLCDLEVGGFCSPFVHEQAMARNSSERTEFGDKHGGSHIHSPYVLVQIDLTNTTRHEMEVTVPTIVNEPGRYFVIGAMRFFHQPSFHNDTITTTTRKNEIQMYDIANAADTRLQFYQNPPMILSVRRNVETFLIVLVIFTFICMGLCLVECIRHRNHKIMQLSQVYFLVVSLVAAMFSSASTVLLNPSSDINCRLYSPMILIPIQMTYSITIGRLWRIQMVVSPFVKTNQNKSHSWGKTLASLLSRIARCSLQPPKHHHLRTVVPWTHMASLALFFTFPQVALQVFAQIFQPNEQVVEFNDTRSIGRATCKSYGSYSTITTFAFYYLIGTMILVLVLANMWKNVPSLFNEVKLVWRATMLNTVVLLLGFSVLAIADDPTMGPEFAYIVWVPVFLSLGSASTTALILPKLQMIWRGETVVVSKLVSDFNASPQEQRCGKLRGVSGFKPSSSFMTEESTAIIDDALFPKKRRRSSQILDTILENKGGVDILAHEANNENDDDDDDDQGGEPIVLEEGVAPSRLLLVPMLQFEQRLSSMNSRVTSGSPVSLDEWTDLKEMVKRLGQKFNQVEVMKKKSMKGRLEV